MWHPNYARYSDDALSYMLFSYRTLSREHIEHGHWAQGAWCSRAVTLITIEMNRRENEAQALAHAQLSLDDPPPASA